MEPIQPNAFALHASFSAVAHAFICTFFYLAGLPVGVGTVPGRSTVFNETLPLLLRYLQACTISVLTAIATLSSVQVTYDLCTIPGNIFLGQDPA
ncbi:hypothetical protein JVT61DRAFT_6661 [Boletus reticuloceps]|uniref:Uncharacterized protein n=1 Tax=Boletus reticuloceps TaxID=495285 RepID=A0A8I3A7Z7_9AGAM|nr:hypothetical protein JVT61DRAFT_6661 [Boletus reticuloceps]